MSKSEMKTELSGMDKYARWLMLTCTEDLLPGVRELGTVKTKNGSYEWLGEIPSRLAVNGQVFRISGYGAYKADHNEIREWCDSGYNLILQTRRIRALTIKFPRELHDDIEERVRKVIGWAPRITCGREGQITFLFEIDGVGEFLTKRATLSPAGMELKGEAIYRTVTLHGTNSSVVVWGHNRRGLNYRQHVDADEPGVPRVSAKALEKLWFSLVEQRSPLFERHEAAGLFVAKHGPSQFVKWLESRQRILDVEPNGDLRVRCPIHKNNRTRATNQLATVSQDESGAVVMVCPHPGCANRTTADFQRLMGYETDKHGLAVMPEPADTPYLGDPLSKAIANLPVHTTPELNVRRLISQYGPILSGAA